MPIGFGDRSTVDLLLEISGRNSASAAMRSAAKDMKEIAAAQDQMNARSKVENDLAAARNRLRESEIKFLQLLKAEESKTIQDAKARVEEMARARAAIEQSMARGLSERGQILNPFTGRMASPNTVDRQFQQRYGEADRLYTRFTSLLSRASTEYERAKTAMSDATNAARKAGVEVDKTSKFWEDAAKKLHAWGSQADRVGVGAVRLGFLLGFPLHALGGLASVAAQADKSFSQFLGPAGALAGPLSALVGIVGALGAALAVLPAIIGSILVLWNALTDAIGIGLAAFVAFIPPVSLLVGLLGGLGAAFAYVTSQSIKNASTAQGQADALRTLHAAQEKLRHDVSTHAANSTQLQDIVALHKAQDAYNASLLGVAINSAHVESKFKSLISTLTNRFSPTIRMGVRDVGNFLSYLDKVAKMPLDKAFGSLATKGVNMLQADLEGFAHKIGPVVAAAFRFAFGDNGNLRNKMVHDWNQLVNFLSGPHGVINPVEKWFDAQHIERTGLRWAHEFNHWLDQSGVAGNIGDLLGKIIKDAIIQGFQGGMKVLRDELGTAHGLLNLGRGAVGALFANSLIGTGATIGLAARGMLAFNRVSAGARAADTAGPTLIDQVVAADAASSIAERAKTVEKAKEIARGIKAAGAGSQIVSASTKATMEAAGLGAGSAEAPSIARRLGMGTRAGAISILKLFGMDSTAAWLKTGTTGVAVGGLSALTSELSAAGLGGAGLAALPLALMLGPGLLLGRDKPTLGAFGSSIEQLLGGIGQGGIGRIPASALRAQMGSVMPQFISALSANGGFTRFNRSDTLMGSAAISKLLGQDHRSTELNRSFSLLAQRPLAPNELALIANNMRLRQGIAAFARISGGRLPGDSVVSQLQRFPRIQGLVGTLDAQQHRLATSAQLRLLVHVPTNAISAVEHLIHTLHGMPTRKQIAVTVKGVEEANKHVEELHTKLQKLLAEKHFIQMHSGSTTQVDRQIRGIQQKLNQLSQKRTDVGKGLYLKPQYATLTSNAHAIGMSIDAGVEAGLKAGQGQLDATAMVIASGVLKSMQNAILAHSPSQKAANMIGVPIVQGITAGMLKAIKSAQTTGSAKSVMQTMLQTMLGVFDNFKSQFQQGFGSLFTGPGGTGTNPRTGFSTPLATMLGFPGTKIPFSVVSGDLRLQLQTFKKFTRGLNELGRKGYPPMLIQQIAALGPGAQQEIDALLSANASQVHQYSKMFHESQKLINSAAMKQTVEQLDIWKSAGKGVAVGILAGLRSAEPGIENIIAGIISRMLKGHGGHGRSGTAPHTVVNQTIIASPNESLLTTLRRASFYYRHQVGA